MFQITDSVLRASAHTFFAPAVADAIEQGSTLEDACKSVASWLEPHVDEDVELRVEDPWTELFEELISRGACDAAAEAWCIRATAH